MVLRDSFMASEKIKIVMLTCICPGMSSANHTLNSLRYAQRLKETSQGQGGGRVKVDPERLQQEYQEFMQKHGKPVDAPADLKNAFYQEDAMDQLMQDNEMLTDDDPLVFGNDIEDDIAMVQNPKIEKTTSQQKTS
jgi:kinesin family protein 2/24